VSAVSSASVSRRSKMRERVTRSAAAFIAKR
jgi:hypothetical protein